MKLRIVLMTTVMFLFGKAASAEIFSGYLIDLPCGSIRYQPNGKFYVVNDPKCIRDQKTKQEHLLGILADDAAHTLYVLTFNEDKVLAFLRTLSNDEMRVLRVAVSGKLIGEADHRKWVDPKWIALDPVDEEDKPEVSNTCKVSAPRPKPHRSLLPFQLEKPSTRKALASR